MVYKDATLKFINQQENFKKLIKEAHRNHWSATYYDKVNQVIQNKNNKDFINTCRSDCLDDLVSCMAPPEFFKCFFDKVIITEPNLRFYLFLITKKFCHVRDSAHRKQYLELFLQQGADLDFECRDGKSTSSYVLKTGDLECIKFLLEKKLIKLDYKDKHGKSFVEYLLETGKLECIKFLLEKQLIRLVDQDGDRKSLLDQKGESRVEDVVQANNLECIKFLLANKCLPLDYIGRYGTPLVQSLLETGDLECIQLLLEKKVYYIRLYR